MRGVNPRRLKIESRRTKVIALYCQGWTQQEIAEELDAEYGVTQQQISLDIAAVQKEWTTNRMETLDEAKARELAKIDALEAQAWESFWKSCGTIVKKTMRLKGQTKDADGKASGGDKEVSQVEYESAGEERYLARVAWCIDERCKILGLHAAQKSEVMHTLGTMTDAELLEQGRRLGLQSDKWGERLSAMHSENGNSSSNGNGHPRN